VTAEELEDALLAYLAKDDSDEPGFQSLTTIYERLPQARLLAEDFPEEDLGLEDKERVRVALDQLVMDGMAESRWGERDYEASYRVTQDGFYQAVVGIEGLVPTEQPGRGIDYARPAAPTEQREALHDSALWTGLTTKVIDARNAEVVTKLIDNALSSLTTSSASNSEIRQAAAYLKAARELTDAPEPPSELIWELISRAANLTGLLGLFYTLFSQALN